MVIKLEPLTEKNIYNILKRALTSQEGLGEYNVKIEDSTLMKIADIANGDVRTRSCGINYKYGSRWIYTYNRWSYKK